MKTKQKNLTITHHKKLLNFSASVHAVQRTAVLLRAYALSRKRELWYVAVLLLFVSPTLFAQSGKEAEKLESEGMALYNQGKYPEATAFFERALAIREQVPGPQHPKVAQSINNLANAHLSFGNYVKALHLYERSLAITEKASGPQHSNTAISLNNLANVYSKMGDYAKALPLYERALAVQEKASGPQHSKTALSLSHLAGLYSSMGDYAKALPLHERALAIREKASGPQHPDTANSLNHLANVYSSMGDYAKALPFLERALAIQEKALGPEHPDTADSLNNLAGLYRVIGDYAKALPLIKRTLAIDEKTLGPQHSKTALSLSHLASLYSSMGDYAKALPLHERALAIQEKALGAQHPDTADSLSNLASLYSSMGDNAKALPLHERALAIREKALGAQHPDTALSLNQLSNVYQSMGDNAKALPLLERALAVWEKTLGPQHRYTAASLDNLATLTYRMGDLLSARNYATRQIAAKQRELQSILTLDERARLAWQRKNLSYWFACVLRPEPLAQLVLRLKGVVLDSLLEDRSLAISAQHDPEGRAKLDEIAALRAKLSKISFDEAKQQESVKLQEQIGLLQRSLATRASIGGRIRQSAEITLDAILPSLSRGAVLVDFIRFDDPKLKDEAASCYGAVVSGADGSPVFVRIDGAKEINHAIDDLRSAIVQGNENGVEAHTRMLSEKLWQPIAKQIPEGIKQVFVCPEAKLNFLSFAALLESDGRFVAEKYNIVYLGSGRDLARIPSGKPAKTMTIIGNPAFEINSSAGTVKEVIAMRSGEADVFGGITLPPLPGTEAEAKSLQSIAQSNDWESKVALGRDANEVWLRNAKNPGVLHLATHGFYLNSSASATGKETRGMSVVGVGDINSSKSQKKDDSSGIGGIGVSLTVKSGLITVDKPLKDSPGYKAGLLPEDELVKINGQPTDKLDLVQAVEKIRGKIGESIRLTIHRPSNGQVKDYELIREAISIPISPMASNAIDPMRASGVALAGAQETLKLWSQRKAPDPRDDGVLTAEEVAALDLDGTWLVTLSACETGVGEARSGEGVFGLRRAFMIAGAENLLMTLWPVVDDTTAKVMTDFYQEAFATGDAPGALAKVQRDWLVKLRNERGLAAAIRDAGPFAMVTMTAPSVKTFATVAEKSP